MATTLLMYKDTTPSKLQTRGLLDQMFAKINNKIKLDEKQDDSSNKYSNSVFGRVTCRDGVDCVRNGCNFGHPKGFVSPTGKGDKCKGDGKDTGAKGSKLAWKCQKPGCPDPLCTTCFKDLGAKGKNPRTNT